MKKKDIDRFMSYVMPEPNDKGLDPTLAASEAIVKYLKEAKQVLVNHERNNNV